MSQLRCFLLRGAFQEPRLQLLFSVPTLSCVLRSTFCSQNTLCLCLLVRLPDWNVSSLRARSPPVVFTAVSPVPRAALDMWEALNKLWNLQEAPRSGLGRATSWARHPQPCHISSCSICRSRPGDAAPPTGEASPCRAPASSLVGGLRLGGAGWSPYAASQEHSCGHLLHEPTALRTRAPTGPLLCTVVCHVCVHTPAHAWASSPRV